ncbi:MAG: PocR ligand-binding domain-containing protein [Clostridiales bacterium]|uniref:PocR ligand-binding domain-containing protein n=1 Tax=Flavonifractor porci TaxID=3133422 RepID=UPI0030ABA089|nr:PocR ligand-binding domain-containing protein [Clostridiales bacterium]
MSEIKKISELIDMNLLQSIQDNCSRAMGIGAVTVDYRGNPITRYSGFTEHCMKVREVQGFSELCAQCDAHGGLHSAITGQPYIYRCHANLVDFAVPLIINGTYMGAVLGGQVKVCEEEAEQLEYILPQQSNWRKHEQISRLYEKMETVSYDKVEAAVHILRDIIVAMTENESGKRMLTTLEEKDKELSEERAARSELEMALREKENDAMGRSNELCYFFYVMNIITRLAYEEKAVKTEQIAYDFADVARYAVGTQKKLSTLGEELDYIGALLRIQKAWVGDKLDFRISVPSGYFGIPCPFMLMQPIVETVFEGFGEKSNASFQLEFYGEEEGNCFLFQIRCSGGIKSLDEWVHMLSTPRNGSKSLYAVNSSLQHVFGAEYGVSVGARDDRKSGILIRIRLPLERPGPF